MDQRRQNNVYAGELHSSSREEELAAFDMLPPTLRWVVNENATKLAASTVLRFAHNLVAIGTPPKRAIQITVEKIRELEVNEISVFAGRYFGEYRATLPHVAAGVTIQRYVGCG
jgi:hypothetical protein